MIWVERFVWFQGFGCIFQIDCYSRDLMAVSENCLSRLPCALCQKRLSENSYGYFKCYHLRIGIFFKCYNRFLLSHFASNALRPKLLFVCGAQENEGLRPNGISYLPSGLVCPHLQLFAQRRQIDWQRENPVQKARHTERAFILAFNWNWFFNTEKSMRCGSVNIWF